jgi:hypothetical protein
MKDVVMLIIVLISKILHICPFIFPTKNYTRMYMKQRKLSAISMVPVYLQVP